MEKEYLYRNEQGLISEMVEKNAIHELILRYFYCLDGRNFELLQTCFTKDAKGEYDGGRKLFFGIEDIIDGLRGITQFKYSHHIIGSMMIEIKDMHAKTDTFCIAFLNRGDLNGNQTIIRGLRYIDDLVKTEDGWKISHRVHLPLWQCEMNSTSPEFMLSK